MGGYAAVEPRANLDVIGGFRFLASGEDRLAAQRDGHGPARAATLTFAAPGQRRSPRTSGRRSSGRRDGRSWAKATGSSTTTPTSAAASSLFTWQGAAGIGYAFRWGDIVFDYRYLYYSQSGDKLIDNVSFGGFALGANFRF